MVALVAMVKTQGKMGLIFMVATDSPFLGDYVKYFNAECFSYLDIYIPAGTCVNRDYMAKYIVLGIYCTE